VKLSRPHQVEIHMSSKQAGADDRLFGATLTN
jgi:hypothetical protein